MFGRALTELTSPGCFCLPGRTRNCPPQSRWTLLFVLVVPSPVVLRNGSLSRETTQWPRATMLWPCATRAFLDVGGDASSVDGFYGALGAAVISTVADGDCGPDAMLHMVGAMSTVDARRRLRGQIADFIVERAKQRWFQEVMAACQEITWEDVAELQRL